MTANSKDTTEDSVSPVRALYSACVSIRAWVVYLILSTSPCLAQAPSPQWSVLADDLQLLRISFAESALFSSDLTAFRTSLTRYRIAVVRAEEYGKTRMEVREAAILSKAALLVNANFFDERGKPLGLVVSRGKEAQPMHRGGNTLTGVFFATRAGLSIVHRESYRGGAVTEAVQAGPRLLQHSKAISGLPPELIYSRRVGICIDQAERLVVYVAAPGVLGFSWMDLQRVLREQPLGCRDALNLDGGKSVQLFIPNTLPGFTAGDHPIAIPGMDVAPVFLGLQLKEGGK